jgi:hypothetical protein
MRDHIIAEIKRLVAESGGEVPGQRAFELATGIRHGEWFGVYWARWGDALTAAGFAPNEWQERFDPDTVLAALAEATRHYGHVPTKGEIRLYRREHPNLPNEKTFAAHFGSKDQVVDRLREWVAGKPEFPDVAMILGPRQPRPNTKPRISRALAPREGFVYLIRSGDHHKIGRSDELERRVKEIRVALPAAAILEHSIRTDDPPGIEAYWHRRFADRRANGEWFKLTPTDVTAFKRRKFQ